MYRRPYLICPPVIVRVQNQRWRVNEGGWIYLNFELLRVYPISYTVIYGLYVLPL